MRAFGVAFFVLAVLFGAYGWGWNIVKLFNVETLAFTGEVIVRVVGIFIPFIGAIVGYF